MENKTKIVLTAIGLAAIIVPAILLIVFSKNGSSGESSVSTEGGSRPLRQDAVKQEDTGGRPAQTTNPTPIASPVPTPSPSPTITTTPLEASGSGGVN